MNKKLIIVLLLIAAIIFIAGCVSNVPAQQVYKNTNTIISIKYEDIESTQETIRVLHDDQYNVTCWTNWEGDHGGISCIPDSQLNK